MQFKLIWSCVNCEKFPDFSTHLYIRTRVGKRKNVGFSEQYLPLTFGLRINLFTHLHN